MSNAIEFVSSKKVIGTFTSSGGPETFTSTRTRRKRELSRVRRATPTLHATRDFGTIHNPNQSDNITLEVDFNIRWAFFMIKPLHGALAQTTIIYKIPTY